MCEEQQEPRCNQEVNEIREKVESIERQLKQVLQQWEELKQAQQQQHPGVNIDASFERQMRQKVDNLERELKELMNQSYKQLPSMSAVLSHTADTAAVPPARSSNSTADGGMKDNRAAAAGSAAACADSSCGGGASDSVEDDLQPLNSADAAQLARQQQSWEMLRLGLKMKQASADGSSPEPCDPSTTTPACLASMTEGKTIPPWQPLCLIEQFLDPDAQRSRMFAQLCNGSHMCNAFIESHKVAIVDAGIPAPLLFPNPPLPPRASPQAPPYAQLPPPSLREHLVTASLGLQKYAEANSDALVRSFAQEVGKERLHALVSSPFSLRLARWHDSLTKLHYAANSSAVDAAEELQRKAAYDEEDEEMRKVLHSWAQTGRTESPWQSQLVACSNISCNNLTRQRHIFTRNTEGVVCSVCSTAVFCSHTCQMIAMTGPQAHCWHVMRRKKPAAADAAKQAPQPCQEGR